MKKTLSMFLALCMIVTMLPVSAAMAEGIHTPIGTSGEIIRFAPLTEIEKTRALGTSIQDLELPETLTATVRTAVSIGEDSVQDSGSPETATPTTAAEPEWEETTVEIPVTWISSDYDPNTESEYVFTPVIEGYIVNAPLPEITVTVGAAVMGFGLVAPLSATTYNIWVGGVQVTSDNKDNITGDGIIGTVSYDPTSSTLTLNNANITAVYEKTEGSDNKQYGIYSAITNLKLVVVGTNTITCPDATGKHSYGIYTSYNLEISGNGSSLTVNSGIGRVSYGIHSWGALTILSGTITATSANAITTAGISSFEKLTIANGVVYASANLSATHSYGIVASSGYTITGGTVTATGKAGLHGGATTNSVTISGGVVNATGTETGITGVLTVTGGTVTVQSDAKALDGTLTTLGYTGCTVTASTNISGSPAEPYMPASLATYKYLKFEPAAGVTEQFNLAPGGTYYFDLSSEMNNIGTVNTALPDTTLHYVPFTYAGTVNAYSLTSAMATTETYANTNKSDRSLFVGDYNVVTNVSWENLNTTGLIFGKTFETNYKLRSLSAGSGKTGSASDGSDHIGQPNTNEWDQILNKLGLVDNATGWIKNWKTQYSWGQDTHAETSSYRAVRGFNAARSWSYGSASDVFSFCGFRPALEVLNPGTLRSDGLKVVTLNLNGGKINESTANINIICAGDSFTAPSSEGLTAPSGKVFGGWKDTNSAATYVASAAVPDSVTALTAQWAALDATAPAITSVNTSNTSGTYTTGDTLSFVVHFNEYVTVNTGGGTPYLSLQVGAQTRKANYEGGNGITSIRFSYTVQVGDVDDNGIQCLSPITLNGGTIKDAAGNDANLIFSSPIDFTGILVDATQPSITTQPTNQTVNEGLPVTFSVTATGTGLTYQWQVNTGSGFTNISNGTFYSGTTTATLTITGVITAGMNGYQYRAVVSGTRESTATSNPATLTVNAPPTYTISGKVVDGNDGLRILGGAKVELKDTSGTVNVTMNITSSDSYSFSNIPAGVYSIVASATGYVSGMVSGITVSNANVTDIKFDLFPFYPVTDITMTNAGSVQVNTDLTLTGTVIPTNATHQSMVWSIESANGTGATISDNAFRATSVGTATVKVTVANGSTASSDYTKTFNITVTVDPVVPGALIGTATISNTAPRICDTLTAFLEGGNNSGTLSYLWKAAGTQVGTDASYTVTAADFGKVITLEITSSVQSGSVISAQTAAVLKKTAPSAPGTLTLVSKTHNSVTLASNVAYEYSKDGIAWQTSNVFGGLTASTTYLFYQRVAATADTEASTISTGFSVTTNSNSSGGDGTGTGSSSNDNNSSVIVTPPAADKPNYPTQGEIKVPGTADGKGNITVSITDKTVTDAFDKALADAKKNGNEKNGITVVLHVDTGSKTGSNVTVNLPKTVQDTIIEKKIVNTIVLVDNPDIRIGMDLATVQEINKQAKSDVNITATRMDSGKLTADAKKAIGSRPVFDLKVNYGSGKAVSNFGAGSVSVTIPYTLGANEKAGNVQAVYVDAKGKVHWLTNSVYDSVEQVLRFSTDHFSTYGIGYKQTNTAFTDIAAHWAKEDIEFVVSRGLFSGTSTTTFSPNTAMTRGMLVTALGRLANADVSDYAKSSFSDVKNDAYYMGYIEWASKNNIVNGVDNGKFASDQSITREQMAVIMSNYAKAIGYTLPKVHVENIFADNAKINAYAKEAVKQMQIAGVISGKNGNLFDPQGTATRAEVSAVLRRFVELTISSDNMQGWVQNDAGEWLYYKNGNPRLTYAYKEVEVNDGTGE